MVSALISIGVLGLLVIVHELGHFLVAKRAGVRVLRFSVGFGKRLVTWTRGGTEYAVSLIPLGGYVKMAGEQYTGAALQPGDYLAQPSSRRAAIILAGPLVNYLTGFLSLWAVFLIGYPELLPTVGKVMEEMPAQAAGLQVGDAIRSVDGERIETWDALTALIYESPGRALTFEVERGGVVRAVEITPQPKVSTDPFGRGKTIGLIGIAPGKAYRSAPVGPVAAAGKTLAKHAEWVRQTLLGLWSMVIGRISMRESVTGPIGILSLTSDAVRMGFVPGALLVSLLSLNLALFNLFPIPILDGGHLLFLSLERLRGRPVNAALQEWSTQISFVLLVGLIVVVCVNDVSRLDLVEKLMGWAGR